MNSVCPYCSAEIEQTDQRSNNCPTCGTAHHGECWSENGGCTVFGCASAPGEGPTITIEPSDLSAAAPPPPPPPDIRSTPPPPPPPSSREHRIPALSLGGYNTAPQSVSVAPLLSAPVNIARPKNRVTYILLGVFLGIFGAHNFYAGYTARAIAQLSITLCTLFFGAIVSWIWAIVELCVVDRDSRNIYMI